MRKIIAFVMIFCSLMCKSYPYSDDYYIGYANAIIDEFLLGQKALVDVENKKLQIKLLGKPLDLPTEQKLKGRLEKLQYFTSIKIKYVPIENSISNDLRKAEKSEKVDNTFSARTEFLPAGAIYDAPIADPKWPNFSVGYQKHWDKSYGKNIFNLSFGDNLALVRHKAGDLTYELGIQAGLSGLIDFSKSPTKLINSDFFVGAGISILHANNWQNLLQFSHMSSHLGDEIMLHNDQLTKKRVNLSYEAFKWYTGYKFDTVRPYVGVGYLIDRDPSTIKPLIIEAGLDYVSAETFIMNNGRFVVGIHTHHWQENRFKPSLNIRPGIQFENARGNGRFLRILLDYSYGNSRHGQFYSKKEQYIGLLISISS